MKELQYIVSEFESFISKTQLSRSNFLGHDVAYYNPPLGKHNPYPRAISNGLSSESQQQEA